MKISNAFSSISLALLLNISLGLSGSFTSPFAIAASENVTTNPEKGAHGGRMLRKDNLALELSIFEAGVPPEFRVWVTQNGNPVPPASVDLTVKLTRLGEGVDNINFTAQSDFLRGDMEIYEPHSFLVTVTAKYKDETYIWEYENFEGRTSIEQNVANAMGIKTEIAGAAVLTQSIPVFGELTLPPSAVHNISARFEGELITIHAELGDEVQKGQTLLTIESNESLNKYEVTAPSNGTIIGQFANIGEQTSDRTLLKIADTSFYMAKLAIFPSDHQSVKPGATATLKVEGRKGVIQGEVSFIQPQVREDQAKIAWVKVSNSKRQLSAGSFVTADIKTATIDVPLAVKRVGLQGFRDFTVVYAKVNEQYEVRMLTLGRQGEKWVEVLGGLTPGTEYVTENSYILKADIEKSGASHDH
ncbi:efflux RND transporter periplasmic adaptor subunit [Alteromonas lipotrueiana]|uniref:efflux RND transporter periplasmic adaptor subunit n=1 Tax=Alteromonas lipotrueiana TaxID=2803815 RepID=UPI001C48216F|nr:efflux RND transporter periplasmic adaptor subunit [Alteromonas lipotrueiana]